MAIQYDHDHENEVTYFGETNFRNARRRFGIKTDDRRRHMYIVGKTGMGKTTLLENLVIQDIHNGHGVAYLDPHGDTAEKILDHIPKHRINDVVYFNPGDQDYPVGFNVLEQVDFDKKHLVAAGLMGVFKKIWPDVWSARMEYILLNCILALLEVPDSTLLGISRLLNDKTFRQQITDRLKDPIVKAFWRDEFGGYTDDFASVAVAPIQNKVGQFLSASIIRNIVSQVKSSFDVRDIMDNGKILVVNLSKGKVGEDNSYLLGGMIVTKIQTAAMERVDIKNEDDRRDFYLYVDEFQNFATESFAVILSEARKYHLNLIMAHQYIAQLENSGSTVIRDAVFGNVGTLVVMRVGAADAEFLEKEFLPQFEANDLVNLAKYTIYLRLMIDGAASEPFSSNSLPPISQATDSYDTVIRVSRERYGIKRSIIEDKVIRFSEAMQSSKAEAKQAARDAKKKPKIVANCSVCGKEFNPPFRPTGDKPVYCSEHYEQVKDGTLKPVVKSISASTSRPRTQDAVRDLSAGKSVTLGDKLQQEPRVERDRSERRDRKDRGRDRTRRDDRSSRTSNTVRDARPVVKQAPAAISLSDALSQPAPKKKGGKAVESSAEHEDKNSSSNKRNENFHAFVGGHPKAATKRAARTEKDDNAGGKVQPGDVIQF